MIRYHLPLCSTSLLNPQKCIAFFGGSFDPIHLGHLELAQWLSRHFAQTWIMPAWQNPLKEHEPLSPVHRLAMTRLAIRSLKRPNIRVKTYELEQAHKSYTVHSLAHFRGLTQRPIVLVMGDDVLQSIAGWNQPREIIKHHSLLVIQRKERAASQTLSPLRALAPCQCLASTKRVQLYQNAFGYYYLVVHLPHLKPFHSSTLRQLLFSRSKNTGTMKGKAFQNQKSPPGLPRPVWRYLLNHHLYVK